MSTIEEATEALLGMYAAAAQRAIPNLVLSDVRLFAASLQVAPDLTGSSDKQLQIKLGDNLEVQYQFGIDGESSSVTYFLTVKGAIVTPEGLEAVTFEVKYGSLYKNVTDSRDSAALGAYGVLVAAMNLWTYVRSYISSQLALMGMGTGMVLPVVTGAQLIAMGLRPPLHN